MDNFDNNELFDLGSSPVGEDFDPFALEDEPTGGVVDEAPAPQPQEDAPAQEEPAPAAIVEPAETAEPVPAEPVKAAKAPEATAEKAEPDADEKPPVFVYAGATETIGDTSMTFDELRIVGHVSCSTTLNVYAHVTDEMRRTAAVKIDQGIGKADPQTQTTAAPRKPAPSTFQAHKGQRRKVGTGCVTQINEKLWEGRYSPIWPDGKKHARNVYAHSEAECEKLLAEMIAEMKAEIAAEKERLKAAQKAV